PSASTARIILTSMKRIASSPIMPACRVPTSVGRLPKHGAEAPWKELPMMNKTLLALAATGLGIAALPATAHHSFAMFDQRKVMTLEGTVAEFQWTNPHSFIEMDVPQAGGSAQRWSIELNSPNNLKR